MRRTELILPGPSVSQFRLPSQIDERERKPIRTHRLPSGEELIGRNLPRVCFAGKARGSGFISGDISAQFR
jgi:hypothetical protein